MSENFYDCFTGKAQSYSESWPRFGLQYYNLIKKYVDKFQLKCAYDVACGTGLHTEVIAPIFKKVYAIEPNGDMLDHCQKNLKNYNNIVFVKSNAESIYVNEKADIIFVAQAFNLFDAQKVKLAFKSIISQNGLVVLTWNNKTDSQIFNDIADVSLQFCPEYKNDCYHYRYTADTFNSFYKNKPNFYKYKNDVPSYLDKETFLKRCTSTSYALNKSAPLYKSYIQQLENLFDKHQQGGYVYYPLDTTVYVGAI